MENFSNSTSEAKTVFLSLFHGAGFDRKKVALFELSSQTQHFTGKPFKIIRNFGVWEIKRL